MCPFFAYGAQTTLASNDPDKCLAKDPPTNLGRAFLTRKRNYCITDANFQNCSLYQSRQGG